MKNNVKLFVGIIIGVLITGGVVYATTQIQASNIGYNEGTVQDALDDLYRVKGTGVQVATITTPGGTYTMQNDGYITGTIHSSGSAGGGIIYYNEVDESHRVFLAPSNESASIAFNVNLFAKKGTNVITRSGYGTYNLTVYEWK